jgi:hypothetical protein
MISPSGFVENGLAGQGRITWSARFFDSIILPDGRKLITLRDAATYITELPRPSTMPTNGRPRWKR